LDDGQAPMQMPQAAHKLGLTITSFSKVLKAWEDITLLAKNEWICWIESAKKEETRISRIKRTGTELMKGKRRPCCWGGCNHR